MNTAKKLTGAALAMAAAGVVLAGCTTNSSMDMEKSGSMEAKIHCSGVNSCKGQTACKTVSNDCKGQNSCKGKGFLSLSKADCDAQGGTVI